MDFNFKSIPNHDNSTVWGLGSQGSYISKKSEELIIRYINDVSKIMADSNKPILSKGYENIEPVILFTDADFAKMNETVCYELNKLRHKLEEYVESGTGDYTGAIIPTIHNLHVFIHRHRSGTHVKYTKNYVKTKKENIRTIGSYNKNGNVLLRRSSYDNENTFKSEVLNSVINAITGTIVVREASGALLKAAISKKADNSGKMLDALDELSTSIRKTALLVEEFYHRLTLKVNIPLKRMVNYTPIIGYQNSKREKTFQRIHSMEAEEETEFLTQ